MRLETPSEKFLPPSIPVAPILVPPIPVPPIKAILAVIKGTNERHYGKKTLLVEAIFVLWELFHTFKENLCSHDLSKTLFFCFCSDLFNIVIFMTE